MSSAFSVQTLNRFAFKKIIDVIKRLKKELRSEYKKNNTRIENESRSRRLTMSFKHKNKK